MFVKLAVLACAVAVSSAAWNGPLAGGVPAHQFPAGVSPQACPNYPNCNNPAVAAQPNAAAYAPAWNGGHNGGWNGGNNGQWNGGNNGQWNGGNNGQWNGGHADGGYRPNNALDAGDYTGDGDYRGEGLAESGAYGNVDGGWNGGNNGGWNGGNNGGWNGGHNAGAYAPGHAGAAVPAGVDPHSCPNYPFCH